MMLRADDEIPLYQQLYQQLRDKIENGALEVGAKLPSMRELAADYGISRLTARKAIEMLVNDGYVYVHHGKGAFVIHSRMLQGPVAVLTPPDIAPEQAEMPSSRVVSVETVEADALLAERLRILPGDKVVRLEHAECVAGIPVVLAVSWLPYELCADVVNSEGPCESLPAVLEKSLGIPLRQTEETVRAALATPRELAVLELPAPSALLLVHRTTYTAQGRVVEYARVAYRADHYRIDLPPKLWQ